MMHPCSSRSSFDRPHDYALDQGADELQRLGAYCRVLERLVQVLDLAPVEGSQVGVQPGHGRGCAIQALAEGLFSCFKVVQLLLQPLRTQPIGNCVD